MKSEICNLKSRAKRGLADDSFVSAFEVLLLTVVVIALLVAPLATAHYLINLLEQITATIFQGAL